MIAFNSVFQNKTVLVTGHTGFKGSWLSIWLKLIGANVVGVSLGNPSDPSNFCVSQLNNIVEDIELDVSDVSAIRDVFQKVKPDYVFHLAAQALVPTSYEEPFDTFMTNAMGTASILDALRFLKNDVVAVLITSDKAYDNVEWVWGYRETDRLGGKDPYSASKGMAELVIRSYMESFIKGSHTNVRVGIARAGNVIGGGDWAKDRIVPDCMKAWSNKKNVDIRKPDATRPWQHVLEPLSGYLALAAKLTEDPNKNGEAYNFGPPANQNYSVKDLIEEMSRYWENVQWTDISGTATNCHEAGLLKLNCDKALFDIKWLPTLKFEETVKMTVEWYKEYYENPDKSMFDFTASQIKAYCYLASERDMEWARK